VDALAAQELPEDLVPGRVVRDVPAASQRPRAGAPEGAHGDHEREQGGGGGVHDGDRALTHHGRRCLGRELASELHPVDLVDDLAKAGLGRRVPAGPDVLTVGAIARDAQRPALVERAEARCEVELYRLAVMALLRELLGAAQEQLLVGDGLDLRHLARLRRGGAHRLGERPVFPHPGERADDGHEDRDHDGGDEQPDERLREGAEEPEGYRLRRGAPRLGGRFLVRLRARRDEPFATRDGARVLAERDVVGRERLVGRAAEGVPLPLDGGVHVRLGVRGVEHRARRAWRQQSGRREREPEQASTDLHAARSSAAAARAEISAKRVWMSQPSVRVRMSR
jgi:hypothetical protein